MVCDGPGLVGIVSKAKLLSFAFYNLEFMLSCSAFLALHYQQRQGTNVLC